MKRPVDSYFWDLPRDGSHLAFAQELLGGNRSIQILPLSGGTAREMAVEREINLTSLDWATDGSGFFVGSGTRLGVVFCSHGWPHGRRVEKRDSRGLNPRGLQSPDGHHLAMSGWTMDSSVWMLENS